MVQPTARMLPVDARMLVALSFRCRCRPLQDCILTLDNRDYLCRKVTGEMDFS